MELKVICIKTNNNYLAKDKTIRIVKNYEQNVKDGLKNKIKKLVSFDYSYLNDNKYIKPTNNIVGYNTYQKKDFDIYSSNIIKENKINLNYAMLKKLAEKNYDLTLSKTNTNMEKYNRDQGLYKVLTKSKKTNTDWRVKCSLGKYLDCNLGIESNFGKYLNLSLKTKYNSKKNELYDWEVKAALNFPF